jgi:hypothetical protein
MRWEFATAAVFPTNSTPLEKKSSKGLCVELSLAEIALTLTTRSCLLANMWWMTRRLCVDPVPIAGNTGMYAV